MNTSQPRRIFSSELISILNLCTSEATDMSWPCFTFCPFEFHPGPDFSGTLKTTQDPIFLPRPILTFLCLTLVCNHVMFAYRDRSLPIFTCLPFRTFALSIDYMCDVAGIFRLIYVHLFSHSGQLSPFVCVCVLTRLCFLKPLAGVCFLGRYVQLPSQW